MRHNILTRRRFLTTSAGVAAGIAAAGVLAAPAAQAAPHARTWDRRTSRNGWPVLDHAPVFRIEGSPASVRLADGDAATILLHISRRFHYEIDELRKGDVHGHTAVRKIAQPYESNYLSGSAMAIRPDSYPVGVRGGYYPQQLLVIRDILAELDGAAVWGGDFQVPKEAHFEIAHQPGHPKVTGAARKIRSWTDGPGPVHQGAGVTDAFDPERLDRARAFARRGAA
jgi:hypothetical protein